MVELAVVGLFLLVVAVVPAAAHSGDCKYESNSGDSYDLSDLTRTTGNFQCFTAGGADGCSEVANSDFYINVCAPTVGVCQGKDTPVCMFQRLVNFTFHLSAGDLPGAWKERSDGEGVIVDYANGDECEEAREGSAARSYSATVEHVCVDSGTTVRYARAVDACHFEIRIDSEHACKIKKVYAGPDCGCELPCSNSSSHHQKKSDLVAIISLSVGGAALLACAVFLAISVVICLGVACFAMLGTAFRKWRTLAGEGDERTPLLGSQDTVQYAAKPLPNAGESEASDGRGGGASDDEEEDSLVVCVNPQDSSTKHAARRSGFGIIAQDPGESDRGREGVIIVLNPDAAGGESEPKHASAKPADGDGGEDSEIVVGFGHDSDLIPDPPLGTAEAEGELVVGFGGNVLTPESSMVSRGDGDAAAEGEAVAE